MKLIHACAIVSVLLVFVLRALAEPVSYTVDTEHSVFAVVTHKAGIAARMAHNHLIVPKTYSCEISSATGTLNDLSFLLQFPVTELAPDIAEAQKQWYPAIKAAGILDTPFSELSKSDRTSIREHMLDKGQLDAEQYPEIKAELVSIQSISSVPSIKPTAGEKTFAHAATIRFTVHGKTVERAVRANVDIENGELNVEAVGRFRFSEFGFEPYSAFFGAVRNQDEFDLYVRIQAQAKEGTEQTGG